MDGPQVNRHINFRFAAGAFRHASTWWLNVIGGLIGGLILWLIGPKIPLASLFTSNPFLANSVTVVVCVLIGDAIVFAARLFWAPIHFALEPDGGLKSLLRTRLGTQMWPILLMGAGLFSFIVLFGLGGILFVIQLLRQPGIPEVSASVPASAQSAPLSAPPKPAKFYSQSDKEGLGDALHKMSEIANTQMGTLVSDSDALLITVKNTSPVGMSAAKKETLDVILQKLDDIAKRWIAINGALFDPGAFFKEHPSYSEELTAILPDDSKSRWRHFQTAMNDLKRGVEVLQGANRHPEDHELVDKTSWALVSLNEDFKLATDELRDWIMQCNQRINEARRSLAR